MARNGKSVGTGNITFEKQLWNAASILWGNMAPTSYQDIVLGLVFLKYISDRFQEKYEELKVEGYGDEEDRDEYDAVGYFFVPEKARWSYILQFSSKPEIGQKLDEAMVEIEKMYPSLKGVLPKNYSNPNLNKVSLGEVVLEFSNIMMLNEDGDKDILGRTYEYFLTEFSNLAGKGGEFFTPPCIVRILVNILEPFKGKVFDPCCGSGGMFVQSAKFIREHSGNLTRDVSIFGQDSNPETRNLCKMNLAIRGIEADLGKTHASSFLNDQHPMLKADFILANPPFNLKNWGADKVKDDVRWKYGVPTDGNANFAWIQHMLSHLSSNGRIGLVLANGSLTSTSNNDDAIRRGIVEDDKLEGIIALPSQLFYTVQIPVCLWFLSKNKKQKDKSIFIDARNLGVKISRTQKEIVPDEIDKIVDVFNKYRAGEDVDEPGFAKVVTTTEIAAGDYMLTPGRYVGMPEEEDDGIPFEEKMTKLTSELSVMFKKSHKLEEKIRENMKAIGYEV